MLKKKSFCYVILHYKNINDTIECIKSIQEKFDSNIVVVDNATLNKNDELLIKKHTDDLILLDKNYGFAKANNIGSKYAIEKYNPDFLVVINNDILINQKEFEENIEKSYKYKKFDMLGPKIITNGGNSVNPFNAYKTIEEVENAISIKERNVKIFSNKILYFAFYLYHKIKYTFKSEQVLFNGDKYEENVALHGCGIIFSKQYYKKYKNVFYNETFLYHEEEFLFYRVTRDKLVSVYDPSIEIFHKEGASLNLTYNKNNRNKELFRNREILKSLNLLHDAMKTNKKI